jgi:hypothetical protein
MKGQWLGKYSGTLDGDIMVNIDSVGGHFEGVAYIHPENRKYPSSVAFFRTDSTQNDQITDAAVNPINPSSGFPCQWEEIRELFNSDIDHAKTAKVQLVLNDGKLSISTTTDIGGQLQCVLERPYDGAESKIESRKMSWKEFQSLVPDITDSNSIYRGQSKPWRLKTAFHRKNRYRISEFVNKDVKQLHRKLSAITSHYFDLNTPEQNGAFFNLLQHHGYPTPLLDWSYSPYVAAFFAFRDRPPNYQGNEDVRIYAFNNEEWQKHFQQIMFLDPAFPHFSVSDFVAIDNPRLTPQQAVTTATNIDDIEAYILSKQQKGDTKYLMAIDIPAKERAVAMRDLQVMGITAGSMFPGVDGVCEELRERNFPAL